ncbi:MAG TPA: hypothetical protein VGD49_03100 [Longimicrobiales bacterium]
MPETGGDKRSYLAMTPLTRGVNVDRVAPPNFGVKLMRPGFGPAAELPTVSPA